MKLNPLISTFVLVIALSACGKDKNVASNALGGCILDSAIDMNQIQEDHLVFNQVITNEGKANSFEFFQIMSGDEATEFVGGAIWDQKGERHGFANSYVGSMNLKIDTIGSDDVKITTLTENYRADNRMVKNEMKIAYNETQLLGLSITFPFENGSKTLCIKSMKLTK